MAQELGTRDAELLSMLDFILKKPVHTYIIYISEVVSLRELHRKMKEFTDSSANWRVK